MFAEAQIVLTLGVLLAVLAVIALLVSYLTAHRLDRLHIRTDLARASLLGSLERRRTVAAAAARELGTAGGDGGLALQRAVEDTRSHPLEALVGAEPARVDPAAEQAENQLGLALARIDAWCLTEELRREVIDVVDRTSMARRFYNDAVRDTRVLREHGLVRVLRLAGHAPMPDYVELVDPTSSGG